MKSKIYALPFALYLAISPIPEARAVDILTTAEHNFFKKDDPTRVGIEVEFTNLSLDDSAKVIQRRLGGKLERATQTNITTLKGYDEKGQPLYNTVDTPYYKLKDSSIGDVLLKLEINQVSETEMSKSAENIIEIVTDPIGGEKKLNLLQRAITDLKEKGARGTDKKTAISTQVNVEIEGGDKAKIKVGDTVNLMREYFRPSHREQINARLEVPKIRQPYVGEYSPGFMKKLLDPKYNPASWQELFDDYVYRQSLELQGDKNAWKMPIEKARAKLLAQKDPIVPVVVKQNAVRISSLLAYMVPNDPMVARYVDSGWIKPYPIVEFREFNNTFDVVGPTRQSLGLVQGAKDYGYFDHDRLMSEMTGIQAKDIEALRERSLKSEKKGKPFSWRYFLADPTAVDQDEYAAHKKEFYKKKDLVGFLSPAETGKQPLFVPGESVIMHRRPIHANNIVGKYNPGLINANVAQALENKYTEALFFNDYAPGAFPKTQLLKDLTGGEQDAAKVLAKLNKDYPKGWILKGVWDLGTEGMLITDKTDVAGELRKYAKSDFDAFKKKLDADPSLTKGGMEFYQKELSSHPGYNGWRIKQTMEKGSQFIVQERMPIDKEFRVEVIGGKVLGNQSTIDRYAYKNGYDTKKSKVTAADVEKVEKFTQDLVNKLPPELRATPWAFDIALNKDGTIGVVESNPGSNSNFLYEEDWKPSVSALTKRLDEIPAEIQAGKIHPGLSTEQQMSFLEQKFKDWKIDPAEQYKGFSFSPAGLKDTEFPERQVSEANYRVERRKDACPNYYRDLRL